MLAAPSLTTRRLGGDSPDAVERDGVELLANSRLQVHVKITALRVGRFGIHGLTVDVRGIPKLLRRAIRNLLENARRYSDGEVEVLVRREGNRAVVRVSDHGPGVPHGQRERIFEPFYRLPGASERAGGVGLGLALVRSIAQRHGGRVYCEDQPGGGTGACFVLELPLQAPQSTPPQTPQ